MRDHSQQWWGNGKKQKPTSEETKEETKEDI